MSGRRLQKNPKKEKRKTGRRVCVCVCVRVCRERERETSPFSSELTWIRHIFPSNPNIREPCVQSLDCKQAQNITIILKESVFGDLESLDLLVRNLRASRCILVPIRPLI